MHEGYKFSMHTPNLRILNCLFGNEVAGKVQTLIDSGVGFHEARKQVVG